MAGNFALCKTVRKAICVFPIPVTGHLSGQRCARRNATTCASSGSFRTKADLPVVTLRTTLYRLIIQGYYKRMHELQVKYVNA